MHVNYDLVTKTPPGVDIGKKIVFKDHNEWHIGVVLTILIFA